MVSSCGFFLYSLFVVFFHGVLIFYQHIIAPRGTKRANSTSASQPPPKKLTLVRSSPPLVKKSIPARFSPPKALLSRWHSASVRDLSEGEINNRYDKNNNDDEAANNDSSLEGFSDDDDIQFTLFDFK